VFNLIVTHKLVSYMMLPDFWNDCGQRWLVDENVILPVIHCGMHT